MFLLILSLGFRVLCCVADFAFVRGRRPGRYSCGVNGGDQGTFSTLDISALRRPTAAVLKLSFVVRRVLTPRLSRLRRRASIASRCGQGSAKLWPSLCCPSRC